jgi:O-antigen/teichoic acid export membrane protein
MSFVEPISPAVAPSAEAREFQLRMLQISGHSAVFFAGTMFTAAVAYLFKIYLARVLGAEALGVYALGMTLAGFFGLFNGLGLPMAALRFVADYTATGRYEKLRALLWKGSAMLLASNLLLAAALLAAGPWIASRFYHTPSLTPYLWFFAAIMALGALTTFFGQWLGGYKDVTRRTVITNFIGNPLMMAITVALIFLGHGLRGYLWAQVTSATLVLALLLRAMWKLTPPAARPLAGRLGALDREVFHFSAAAFGVSLLEFVLAQADKVLIGFYLNARDVGIYAAAAAIVAFVPVVLQSVNQIFSPTIADLHARGDHITLARMFQSLTRWILGLTFPLAVVVSIFAAPLMNLFGREFAIGWPVLVIGALGQFVNCGTGSVGYLLLMAGQQGRLVKVQTWMALVMIALNVALIPRWGVVGAAMATAAVNAGTNLWNLREVRGSLALWPYSRNYWKLVPAFAAVVAATAFLKRALTSLLSPGLVIAVTLLAAYAVLAVALVAFGLGPEDKMIAQAVWSRVRKGVPA